MSYLFSIIFLICEVFQWSRTRVPAMSSTPQDGAFTFLWALSGARGNLSPGENTGQSEYMWWNSVKYWDPNAMMEFATVKDCQSLCFQLEKAKGNHGKSVFVCRWAGGVFWDSVIFPDNEFLDEGNVVLTPKCRYGGDTTNKKNTIWVILVYLEMLDLLPFFRAVSIGRNDVTKPSWRLGWPWTAQQLGILVHQKTGNSCTNVWNPHSLKLYMHHCVFSWWIPHVCYVNYPFYPFSIGHSPICIYNFDIYIYINYTYIYIYNYIYMHYIYI